MIKGVVFDMDGLMLDSEVLYKQATVMTLEQMGFEPDLDVISSTIGMPESTGVARVAEHYGASLDVVQFRKLCRGEMDKWYLERSIPTKAGLFELLDYLRHRGIVCGVASSTIDTLAVPALERLGIAPYMSTYVFGNMITNGKPAPDIFAEAVRRLELTPDQCMGLEDSYNGIRSSKGAGLYTVMVPDLLPPTDEINHLLDGCVDTLTDVMPLLDRLNDYTPPKGLNT